MLEILQFYVSSFWVWLGITLGMLYLLASIARIIRALKTRGSRDGQ